MQKSAVFGSNNSSTHAGQHTIAIVNAVTTLSSMSDS